MDNSNNNTNTTASNVAQAIIAVLDYNSTPDARKAAVEFLESVVQLSTLVIDQGTIVDRIDYNIENFATTVEDGLKQLQNAEPTQRHRGMVKLYLYFKMLQVKIRLSELARQGGVGK